MIPDNWTKSTFGKCLNVISGKGFAKSEYTKSGVKLLRIDNVGWGEVLWDSIAFLPKEYLDTYENLVLRKNDILLALNRPLTKNRLKLAKLPKKDEPSLLYQRVGKIEIKSNSLDSNFIYYFLHYILPDFVKRSSVGSDQPFINITQLKSLSISLPPLAEQKKIAEILSCWDRAIEYVSNRVDFQKSYQECLRKKLLQEYTERNWFKQKLSDVAEITMGQSPSSKFYNEHEKGLPLLQGKGDLKGRKPFPDTWTTEFSKKASKGEILITVRAPVGFVSLCDSDYALGRGLAAVKPTKISSFYLYEYLVSIEAMWKKLEQGSTFSAINSKDLKNMEVIFPADSKDQKKIGKAFQLVELEKEAWISIKSELKKQKKGLMQQLLTGKVRVKV